MQYPDMTGFKATPYPVKRKKPRFVYNPFNGEIRHHQKGEDGLFVMGWINSTGHRLIRWEGKPVSYARLCWFLSHGEWVKRVIHVNGDKSDLRLVNLKPSGDVIKCNSD
jgi:hypothetical protein